MLVKIGEMQWIKAKKIDAVKVHQRPGGKWALRAHTAECVYDYGVYDDKEEALRQLYCLAATINNAN